MLNDMNYSLGLDVGSVSTKLSLIDEDDQLVYIDTEKIVSNPKAGQLMHL
jgi:activator of 2-hydroxyglutaryl-CoA dehydratase